MDQIMGRGKDQIKKEFDPYASMFSSFGGGVNESAYSLTNSLNDAATVMSKITGLPKGNFFEQAAKEYMENANFWQDKEANYKLDPVTKMATHAAGAAIPGITNFALGPVWAVIQGATEAEMAGNNPLTGAITGGLERYVTGKVLNAINTLSLPIRAPLMGATGAAQATAQGGDEQDIANSFGEMALYGMMGPRGGKTAKDIYEDFRFSQPQILANERGAIDMSGKKEPTGKTPSKPEGGDYIISGKGEDLVTLYHGTTKEGIESINRDGHIQGFKYFGNGRWNGIALTPDKKRAENWAKNGGVIEVKVPKSDLVVDSESNDNPNINEALERGQDVYALADRLYLTSPRPPKEGGQKGKQ